MQYKKYMLLSLMMLFLMVCATGCSGVKGKIAPQKDVDAKVAQIVINEDYSFAYEDAAKDILPRKVDYYYSSNERELTFKGTSTLKKMYFQQSGELPFYTQSIDVDYLTQVQNIYNGKALEILKESPLICVRETRSWSEIKESSKVYNYDLLIESFEDIKKCAKTIGELQSLYSAEQQYNSQQWVSNHPLMKIRMLMEDGDENTKLVGIIPITGLRDESEVYRVLCIDYALMIENELLPEDKNVPQEIFDIINRDPIRKAYIDDTKLSDNMANHQVPGFYNNMEGVFLPQYNYDLDTYTLVLDCGLSEEKCNPHPLETYVENAGGKCSQDYNTGVVEWKIGKNKYRLESSMNETGDSVDNVTVYRNGEDMELNFVVDSDAAGGYLIVVPVSEVARLFELDYEIDEENLAVRYETSGYRSER